MIDDNEYQADRGCSLLTRRDKPLLAAAHSLLKKVLRSSLARPAKLASVAKLSHAIDRLAKVIDGVQIYVLVSAPARRFGQVQTHHYWEVEFEHGGFRHHRSPSRSTRADYFDTTRPLSTATTRDSRGMSASL